jgi:ribosomal-protein-alanine N-acetyltransferase
MHVGHLGRKQIKTLETARLAWIPWTLETMDAFIEGRPGVAARVWNAAVPHDFPNGPYRENLPYFRQVLASSRAGLDGVIIEREHRTVIGGMGFRTPSAAFEALGLLRACPALEIGFGILADYWNRGYATEMARVLVSHVLAGEAAQVVAESEEDNAASIRVLEKAGFHRIGSSGTLLLWDHGESARV